MENEDYEQLARVAHKIKPSINMMDIASITGDVQKIEVLATTGEDLHKLPSIVNKVVETCEEAVSQLKKKL